MSNDIIAEEYKLYYHSKKKYYIDMLTYANDYKIWKFQKALRLSEYYKAKGNIFLYLIWRHIKNRRGLKLGFDIPEGCFERGLRIYHISPVIVNPSAHIGKNCIIVGNTCIGNVKGQQIAPNIGDNCMLGWGTTIIGGIRIAKNCSIGAGAVVANNVIEEDATLVGVPAKIISIGEGHAGE